MDDLRLNSHRCNGFSRRVMWIATLVGLVMLLCAAVPGHAASGKALINGFRGRFVNNSYYVGGNLVINNVSSSTVTVKVTFYKQDGTIITDDGSASTGNIISVYPGSNYSDNVTNATVSFDLAPYNTTLIGINPPGANVTYGYGVIEWTSSSQDPNTLMAYGFSVNYTQSAGESWSHPYFINNGMPF